LDTSFDDDGIVTLDFAGSYDAIHDIAVLDDGRILVAGFAKNGSYYDFAMARFNTDGSLDTGFGDDGMVLTSVVNGYNSYCYAVDIQSDGKIILSGYNAYGYSSFAVARYNSDGTLDTTFDGDGKLTTDFGRSVEYGRAMALQADDRIVVGGTGQYNFQLVRYLPGNVPDDVSVTNVAPTLTLGGDSVVDEGAPYTLTLGTVDDPGQDTVQKYVIDWGDGQQSTYTAAEIATLNRQVTHVYTHGPSSPTISVNLIDEDGRYVGVLNKAVTVEDAAPSFAPGSTSQVGYIGYHDNGDPITFPTVVADPADALTYELSGLPEEMADSTIDANGIFHWTPAASDAGETYTFDVTVTNQSELSATETFTLAVQSFFTSAGEIAFSTVRTDALRMAWPNCSEGQFQLSYTGETPANCQLVVGSGGVQDGMLMISSEGYLSWTPYLACREETYYVTVTYTHPSDQPVTKDITLNLANEDLRPAFFIDRPDPVYDDIHEQHWHGHDKNVYNDLTFYISQIPGVYERQLQLPLAYDREGAVTFELIADPEKYEYLPQDAEIDANGLLTCKFTSPDDAYQVYQFDVKATDSTGHVDVRHVVLGVHVLYQGYIATQIATNTYAAVEENSGVNQISVMGIGSELMSYCNGVLYIDAPPAHGTLQLDPDYLGCVLYAPDLDYRGLDTFAYHWEYEILDYWHPYTLPPLGRAETNVSQQQIQVGNWVDLEVEEEYAEDQAVLAVGGKTTTTLTLQNPRADGVSTPGFWELNFNPDLIRVYDTSGKEILPPPSMSCGWPGSTFLETVADQKQITLTVVGVSAGQAELTASWNAWGGEHDSTLYPDQALFDGWHWVTTQSVDFAVVEVDIDTDSNNDGNVDRTDAEDAVEDVAGSGVGQVGKRIFVNTDDDNKNGKADSSDVKSAYTAPDLTDNDFAQIMLDMAGVDLDDLAGHRLYLIADERLNIWAD
ncbi:MAG: putative Ig domain-containing protein, partial [Pirellulales bacterium]|nr:putative Ig domain-containing protein [Pirellulales bacterium]